MERSSLNQSATSINLPYSAIAPAFALLDAVDACIVVFSPQGKVEFANRTCAAAMGISSDRLVGKRYSDFSPFQSKRSNKSLPHTGLVWAIQHDDSHWIEWSIQRVLISDTSPYVMATGRLIPAVYPAEVSSTFHSEVAVQFAQFSAKLEQVLGFEEILKRITDRVRDSLDEAQILQTAVNELGKVLEVACCDTGIYTPDCSVSTISYEYSPLMPSALGKTFQITEVSHAHIYGYLLRGDYVQFCDIAFPIVRPIRQCFSTLACPIYDNQGTLGDLWLFRDSHSQFNELEIRLVQQVANQCAIAIRQARLYQATESQVEALANLIRVKDDFLSRVSHELRTPVSNMKMAIQMLGITLNQERPFLTELSKPPAEQSRLVGYYRVLRDECEREISLLNDLLDLQRLDSGTHPFPTNLIYLTEWLPQVLKPFRTRAQAQQQIFEVTTANDLPALVTSAASLERVLRELLDNACKYTPPGESISVNVWGNEDSVSFDVINTGVEIPEPQLPRIFERFYWVPTSDRWQQGGTGLGLALVQRLTKRMGGVIMASSQAGVTRFCVELPLSAQPAAPSSP